MIVGALHEHALWIEVAQPEIHAHGCVEIGENGLRYGSESPPLAPPQGRGIVSLVAVCFHIVDIVAVVAIVSIVPIVVIVSDSFHSSGLFKPPSLGEGLGVG